MHKNDSYLEIRTTFTVKGKYIMHLSIHDAVLHTQKTFRKIFMFN